MLGKKRPVISELIREKSHTKIFKNGDYRRILLDVFNDKQREIPGYTMRQFAQLIDTSPAKLSMILNGKTGISPTCAEAISKCLQFSPDDEDYFVTLVSSLHHRSLNGRRMAKERLKNKWGYVNFDELPLADFAKLSDWKHFAVLHMVDVKNFRPDPDWIARRLNLSEEEVSKICEDLFSIGFLKVDEAGQWYRDSDRLQITVQGKSEILQKMHAQLITKALESVSADPSSRYLSTNFLTISNEKMPIARQRIKEFSHALINELSDDDNKGDRVVALTMQLFNIDKPVS